MKRLSLMIFSLGLLVAPNSGYSHGGSHSHGEAGTEPHNRSLTDREGPELSGLRAEIAKDPSDTQLLGQYVRELIDLSRRTGEGSVLASAERAMEPFWEADDIAPSLLLLRAIIKQADHRFHSALQDLEVVLEKEPANGQALLTKAAILQVTGRYEEAARLSLSSIGRVPYLAVMAMSANIGSLQGKPHSASMLLEDALRKDTSDSMELRQWALSIAAEIDWRRGDDTSARGHFEEAVSIGPNVALTYAYADFLIETGDYRRALEILAGAPTDSETQLRQALALKASGAESLRLKRLLEQLEQHFTFEERKKRGRHYRSEARYHFHLADNPSKAYVLAVANWEEQKEYQDAVLLLKTALESESAESQRRALQFVSSTGISGKQLDDLAGRLDSWF